MKKALSLVTVFLICIILPSGCRGRQGTNAATQDQKTNTITQTKPALKDELNLGGSTSVEDVVAASIDEFIAQNPNVTGKYDATGSTVGIENATDGTYHLGFSSRELTSGEALKITRKTFALDGIAVALNPANPVTGLTIAQLQGIYTGKLTNWKEVGGSDAKIVAVSREVGSGTRTAFEDLTGFKDNALTKNATVRNGNSGVAAYIAAEQNAVGYLSFVTLDENKGRVKGIKVEDVDATVGNVLNKTYKLSRPFIVVYKDSNLNAAEKAFVDFLTSEEGQEIVENKGAIRIQK